MVECSEHPCPVCKRSMIGRQKSACSGKCRAALSRQKKTKAQNERDQRLQRLVEILAREVGLKVGDYSPRG